MQTSDMHTLKRRQTVRTSLAKAWDFLKNPANLNSITPDDLCFEIISDTPETMYNGLLIEYRIHIPLIGSRKWLAEIKHVREQHSFVDEQRIGPYAFWYHYHQLDRVEGGVQMIDTVYYRIPYGIFGKCINMLYVRKTLDRIFDHRQQKVREILEEGR